MAADNVELTPDNRLIEGLVRQRTPFREKLPERQQAPLHYRGADGAAVFAADFRVHPQRIAVNVASQVTLGQRTAEVEQKQSYTIAYEPVDRLTIAVPRALAATKRIQVFCDGKPLPPVVADDGSAGDDNAAPVSMRVTCPARALGHASWCYSIPFLFPSRRPSDRRLPFRCRCRRMGRWQPTA